ncbi:hypothetical protein BH20ACT24_BH20ACT24_20630 [soil metagenome]
MGLSIARRTGVAGLALACVLLGACGGGSDEEQIETVVRDALDSFVEKDPAKFVGLFSEECELTEEEVAGEFESLEGSELQVEVTDVVVRNLEDDTAEASAEGSVTVDGQEVPLSQIAPGGQEFLSLVKEDGNWKIADCPEG